MHRVTIKPENGRVEALKAHSRASSAVENSRNMPLCTRDLTLTRTHGVMMKDIRPGKPFFFFFFFTRNVGAARESLTSSAATCLIDLDAQVQTIPVTR